MHCRIVPPLFTCGVVPSGWVVQPMILRLGLASAGAAATASAAAAASSASADLACGKGMAAILRRSRTRPQGRCRLSAELGRAPGLDQALLELRAERVDRDARLVECVAVA